MIGQPMLGDLATEGTEHANRPVVGQVDDFRQFRLCQRLNACGLGLTQIAGGHGPGQPDGLRGKQRKYIAPARREGLQRIEQRDRVDRGTPGPQAQRYCG